MLSVLNNDDSYYILISIAAKIVLVLIPVFRDEFSADVCTLMNNFHHQCLKKGSCGPPIFHSLSQPIRDFLLMLGLNER